LKARALPPALLALALAGGAAHAQESGPGRIGPFDTVPADPRSELWVDSGFATLHFDRDRNLNGGNRGLGAEYRFAGTLAAVAGRFVNSDRAWSNYAGVIWQPLALGPVRIGAAVAAFDGYPKMHGGGWFPAAIPTFTADYERVGVNVGVIPTYKDRLYGGISLQLKLKLFDGALAAMACALTEEISAVMGERQFDLDPDATAALCRDMLADGRYFALVVRADGAAIGFAGLSEGCSLYAGGAIGTIQELYVAPAHRAGGAGAALLEAAGILARERGWRRLEVCTPPLPAFARSLAFYERHGFAISGGRKLKKLL
jgi:GNAT superfamily N-acetyltransferase